MTAWHHGPVGQRNVKRNTRDEALETIRTECAIHGTVTKHAHRVYVENRISMAAYRQACEDGFARRKRQMERGETPS